MQDLVRSKVLQIPIDVVDDVMTKCEDDHDIWSVVVAAGLTTAITPETESSKRFHREEEMIIEEIQKYGVSGSTLLANRWAI